MALQVSPSASSKIRRARRAKSARTALPLACWRSSMISASVKFIVSSKEGIYYLFKSYDPLVVASPLRCGGVLGGEGEGMSGSTSGGFGQGIKPRHSFGGPGETEKWSVAATLSPIAGL